IHCMPWLSALCWQWNPEFWPPGHVIAKIAQVSLPNKPDDLPAPSLPAEIRHMRRIIGRMRVYRRSNQGKIKPPLICHQRSDGGWALTRMNEISSMLSYEAYAEASGSRSTWTGLSLPRLIDQPCWNGRGTLATSASTACRAQQFLTQII